MNNVYELVAMISLPVLGFLLSQVYLEIKKMRQDILKLQLDLTKSDAWIGEKFKGVDSRLDAHSKEIQQLKDKTDVHVQTMHAVH